MASTTAARRGSPRHDAGDAGAPEGVQPRPGLDDAPTPAGPGGAQRKPPQFFFPDRSPGAASDDDAAASEGGGTPRVPGGLTELSEADRFDVLEHELPSARAGKRRWAGAVLAAVALSLAAGVAVYLLAPRPPRHAPRSVWDEACSVLCQGAILEAVQSARLSADSKTFVDMPMVMDPRETLQAWAVAFGDARAAGGPPPSREELAAFVSQYFYAPGSDTVPHVQGDWQPAPPALVALRNETLRAWALGLNDLWLQLGRRIIPSVAAYQQRYSMLWQPHPLVVPGGRFAEQYFWDSAWIVTGLLHCGMTETALGVVLNLLYLADTFGFVPNGGRVYYVLPGRSQPPMLSSMVGELWAATGNVSFLATAYGALAREYVWWSGAGEYGHAVAIMEPEGGAGNASSSSGGGRQPRTHILNRYVTDQHIPRPEVRPADT